MPSWAFASLKSAAASGAKEGKSLRHEVGVVLEDPAMPGVFVDHQFCPGDASGHVGAIHGRDHDIVVAIRNQDPDLDPAEILRRLTAPGFDRLELPQESTGVGPLSRPALRSCSRFRKAFAARRPSAVDVKNR